MASINGENIIAKIELFGVGDMNKIQKKEIASWLQQQAKALIKEGDNYHTKFKSSYFGK